MYIILILRYIQIILDSNKYKCCTFISIYYKYKKSRQVWLKFQVEFDDIYLISIYYSLSRVTTKKTHKFKLISIKLELNWHPYNCLCTNGNLWSNHTIDTLILLRVVIFFSKNTGCASVCFFYIKKIKSLIEKHM